MRIAPNGKRYKPLFAPFIIDLDGKVNINIAGNVRLNSAGPAHGSNLGLTQHEINPQKALGAAASDWFNILAYRYGADGVPGRISGVPVPAQQNVIPVVPGSPPPPFYGAGDLDAAKLDPKTGNRVQAEKRLLPSDGGFPWANTVPFAYFSPDTYASGNLQERLDHPWLFNYYSPRYTPPGRTVAADDRMFNLNEIETLYRYSGTNSPLLNADLLKSAPLSFANQRSRLLVTTHSSDLSRPANVPWISSNAYTFVAGSEYPTATPVDAAAQNSPSPNTGEYAGDYRGFSGRDPLAPVTNPPVTSMARRLDLNRPLPPYPVAEADGHIDMNKTVFDPITGMNQKQDFLYDRAVQQRQWLCKDIFDRLRFLTTGARPGSPIVKEAGPPYPNFDALRYLAQLATNIVDHRDLDDYATPFPWFFDKTATPPVEYVLGTELPQLALNETYIEAINDPVDPGVINATGATTKYHTQFWIELLNPHMQEVQDANGDGYPDYPRRAHLQVQAGPGWTPYKLQIVDLAAGAATAIDRSVASNPTGDVTPANGTVVLEVDDFTPAASDPFNTDPLYHYVVNPVNQNAQATTKKKMNKMGMNIGYFDNDGFYVMGPDASARQDAGRVGSGLGAHHAEHADEEGTSFRLRCDGIQDFGRSPWTSGTRVILRRLAVSAPTAGQQSDLSAVQSLFDRRLR